MTIPITEAIRAVKLHIAMCDAALDGPWVSDEIGHAEGCPNLITVEGSKLIDIRGWGYLTGTGGLRLTPQQGMEMQAGMMRFISAARAGYKASLEFMLWWCGMYVDHASIKSDHPLGLAVLPLIAHLDATRPNWRTNEPV